jgi:hypothetical protein
MSVSPTLNFLPAAESSEARGDARAAHLTSVPRSGGGSLGESQQLQNGYSAVAGPQDEVKVQIEPPAEIAVYQFVNQQGTLVLQVPPQQMLNIANDISQELAQERLTEKSAAVEGGKDHGH